MITTTTFYASSNGDRWRMLHDDQTGRFVVRHEPSMASGGKATDVDGPEFLSRNSATPQGIALRELLEKNGAIGPDIEA
jgi:hypothetical protein